MEMTIVRFALVGVINTAIGFACILLGLKLGLGDYIANAAGYALGLGVSYILNRRWTFKVTSSPSMAEFGWYVALFVLAYSANLGILAVGRSAGMAGQPLLHLAGLGLYSLLFYVLSRFLVVRESPKLAETFQILAPLHVPEAILVCVAAIAAFWLHDISLTHDVVWQLWIARQIIHGAELYRDIMELNPPLWFWSAVPLEWVGAAFDVPAGRLLVQVVVAGAALSALAVGKLTEPDSPIRRGTIMLLAFLLTTVMPLYDFGQREQLALICALPYAALIARRQAGSDIRVLFALLVGIGAAYGFALKHYFAIIPIALEGWLLLHSGRNRWRPFRPETIALAVGALSYSAAVLIFTPEFLRTMLPMVQAAYHGYESPWRTVLLRPWTAIWVCLAVYL